MKISSVNNAVIQTRNINNKNNNSPNFKGAGVDKLIDFWQFIDNGGRALQFTAEDMTGTNIPRSIKGLLAGIKYTGHINIPAFLQEAIREFLTGPTMCVVPWVIISLTKKAGKTANTHTENIRNLSYLLSQTDTSNVQNVEELKSAFFNKVSKDMLRQTIGTEEVAKEDVQKLADIMKQLSQNTDKKAEKQILSNAQTVFENIVKANKDSYKDTNFLAAKYTIEEGKVGATKFKNYLGYTTSYIQDFTKKWSTNVSADTIKSFEKNWVGKRIRIAAAMVYITGILMSQIPKLYTKASGRVNPNASAIYDEAKKEKEAK